MNASQKQKKTHVGVELIRRIAAEGDHIFSTDRARELAPEVGLKDSYLREALYHLRRNGWIVPSHAFRTYSPDDRSGPGVQRFEVQCNSQPLIRQL